MKKIAIIQPFSFSDIFQYILHFFSGEKFIKNFEDEFKKKLNKKYCMSILSGLTCFHVILKVLNKISSKKEVVIPAYAPPALVNIIKDLNLEVVLVDISMETFNIDTKYIESVMSKNTLCIVFIHLFGLPCNVDVVKIKENYPWLFIIEDCAQALGTVYNGENIGAKGDINFFSFGRGKNLSSLKGGLIVTDSEKIAEIITEEIKTFKFPSVIDKFKLLLQIIAISSVIQPNIYSIFFPIIKRVRENIDYGNIEFTRYSSAQSAIVLSLLKKEKELSKNRFKKCMKIFNGLRENNKVILPKVDSEDRIAFNRFPILIKHQGLKVKLKEMLWEKGIESSYLYSKPLHHIFELGYRDDIEPFPNATYFADHLITLPVHSSIDENKIDLMIETINSLHLD